MTKVEEYSLRAENEYLKAVVESQRRDIEHLQLEVEIAQSGYSFPAWAVGR